MKRTRLPSLAALRAFEAVARAGSVKKASQELYVTPGAVSQLIKKLEEELSTQLFERKNREMSLTEDGSRLRDGAFDAFRLLKKTVSSLSSQESIGNLRIACDASIAIHWLAPRLSQILAIDSTVNIEVHSFDDASKIAEQTFDIVLSRFPVKSNQYTFDCLGNEIFSVLTSPEYANEMKQRSQSLLTNPVLLNVVFPERGAAPTWNEWFETVQLDGCENGQNVFFGEALDDAIEAAKNGTGLILAPLTLVSKDIHSGRLISPFKTYLESNLFYWLGSATNHENSQAVQKIKAWIANELEQSIVAQYQRFETHYESNIYAFTGVTRLPDAAQASR